MQGKATILKDGSGNTPAWGGARGRSVSRGRVVL